MLGPRLEVTVAEGGGLEFKGVQRPGAEDRDITGPGGSSRHHDVGASRASRATGLGVGLCHAGSLTQVQWLHLIPETAENWVMVYVRR